MGREGIAVSGYEVWGTSMIPTAKRLEYAAGFIGLGLVDEAADELEAIAFSDRMLPAVLLTRIELYVEAEQWDMVVDLSSAMITRWPQEERPWIAKAYALREFNRIVEAREVLLLAEPLHGKTCGLLHYNLACYYSLLGDQRAAKDRLSRACKMDQGWEKVALDEQDLAGLWGKVGRAN